jgi:hypothetical protein
MYFLMQKPVQTIKINTYFETDAMKTDSLIIFFFFQLAYSTCSNMILFVKIQVCDDTF